MIKVIRTDLSMDLTLYWRNDEKFLRTLVEGSELSEEEFGIEDVCILFFSLQFVKMEPQ